MNHPSRPKTPHFTQDQIDYIKKLTPLKRLSTESSLPLFVRNNTIQDFHELLDNILIKQNKG